jgi:hypothetical protein
MEKPLNAYEQELEMSKRYTPEQKAKLDKINRSLGKWKRKTLSAKELNAIASGKELSPD